MPSGVGRNSGLTLADDEGVGGGDENDMASDEACRFPRTELRVCIFTSSVSESSTSTFDHLATFATTSRIRRKTENEGGTISEWVHAELTRI